MDTQWTLLRFIPQIRHWHSNYLMDNPGVLALELRIQRKAQNTGYLEKADLKEIAIWGGNAHSRWQQMWKNNTEEKVRKCTAQAASLLNQPEKALEEITRIDRWGESFGSNLPGVGFSRKRVLISSEQPSA